MTTSAALDGGAASKNQVLKDNERLLFQVREGPCEVGCSYCYERPVVERLVAEAVTNGKIGATDTSGFTNLKMATFLRNHQDDLGFEITVSEFRRYLILLKELGIDRAGLIGSEPTSHSQFRGLLDTAHELGAKLLVYTGAIDLDRLFHPAVNVVVLHLDFSRYGDPELLMRKFANGELPSDSLMKKVHALIASGREVHLRVNFSSSDMFEQHLIYAFYEKLKPEYRASTPLKYSFTTRVSDQPDIKEFDPELLRETMPRILGFVDAFKARFPEVRLFAERPLFPCSFAPETWEAYREKAGLVSRCDMEYTVYPGAGVALCPPSRALEKGEHVVTSQQLAKRIAELRTNAEGHFRTPSFPVCEPCEHRISLRCQGGCGGYKVPAEAPRLLTIRTGPLARATVASR